MVRIWKVVLHHKDIPKGMSFFIFLKQSVKFFRRSCGLDAGGEIDPNPGDGRFSSREGGCFFFRLRRRGVRTLRRAGSVPPSAAGELLPGGSRGLQKGVQDTTKDVVSAVAH